MAISIKERTGAGIATLALVLLAGSVGASGFQFYEGGTYDPAIPTPASVLDYELGERFTHHYRIAQYLEALSEASNRVSLERYGQTYEGRPLIALTITSSENQRRLSEIRRDLLRLSDDSKWSDQGRLQRIIRESPAVAWLSYGVHGNEPSSSEAAMQMAYQLAAGTDEQTLSILKNLIVIIDPCLNPDGRDRYVNWYQGARGMRPNPDPQSVEHQEPWPGGRYNHYLFDLNRDWAWMTQQETVARLKAYRAWMPQVHVDFHEMGREQSYFFFPSAAPVNTNIPKNTSHWGSIFGEANAAEFDRRGWAYYTGEDFDLFYPGYGDTWPSLNGAIGMTYEQGGGGSAGLAVRNSDGKHLKLRERAWHHFVASMTTLRTTADHRVPRLRDFHEFWRGAAEEGEKAEDRFYIINPARDPVLARQFALTLLAQGVDVQVASQELKLKRAHTYFEDKSEKRAFPVHSYVIDSAQPHRRLIKAIFEEESALPDTDFYDITSWVYPVAFNLDMAWTRQLDARCLVPFDSTSSDRRAGVAKASYAYLIPWNGHGAIGALAALLRDSAHVRVATDSFTMGAEQFSPGTLVLPVSRNGGFEATLILARKVAREHGASVLPTNTGMTEKGIDLGSRKVRWLKPRRIGVASGEPVSPVSYGALWHMFETGIGVPFSAVPVEKMAKLRLSEYDVLVLPNDYGAGRGYTAAIDSAGQEQLKAWVRNGGVLVAIQGGAVFASKAGISSVKLLESDKGKAKGKEEGRASAVEKEKRRRRTLKERRETRKLDRVPGVILSARLDTTHPLGYGYDERLLVFKRSALIFELSDRAHNVAIFQKEPRQSGFLSEKMEEKISGSGYLFEERLGAGHVVLFTEDPNFRQYWKGLTKLFINSIYFVPGM